jgi:hypothetical protein
MPLTPGAVMMAVVPVMSPVGMVAMAVPAIMMAVPAVAMSVAAVRPDRRRKRERSDDKRAFE